MRESWKRVPLRELTTQVVNRIPVVDAEEYVSLGLRMYGNGVFAREAKPGSDIKAAALYTVAPGQFIYNRMFASGGSFGLVPNDLAHGVVSNEFPVFDVDSSRLLPEYLDLYFKQPSVWGVVEAECVGTTKSRLRWKEEKFGSHLIPLPPRAEQRRIVDLVGSLDEAIEAADEAHARLESAQFNALRGIYVGMESELTSVAALASFMIGGAWGDPEGVSDTAVNALGPSAFANGAIEVDASLGTARSLSLSKAMKRYLQPGDIVIERSGGSPTQPVGRVIRASGSVESTVPSDFMRLVRIDPELAPSDYVFWALWMRYRNGDTVAFQKNTTNIRNLNLTDYLSSEFRLLKSPDDQRHFVALAESFLGASAETRANADSLRNLRSNLLTALLSGEHEIPESYDDLLELEATA